MPASPDLARRLGLALGGRAGADAEPPPDTSGVAPFPQPWSWPSAREIVPAAIAASVVLALGLSLQVFPAHALDHVRDAYRLTYIARSPAGIAGVAGAARGGRPESSRHGRHLSGRHAVQAGRRAAATGACRRFSLAPSTAGHYYQARATLPNGNLAVSNAEWVPSDTEVVVSIDAQPWANVTVKSGQTTLGPQATPFLVSLVPGSYQLHFDNNGVTPPMDQAIGVTPENRVFSFRCPVSIRLAPPPNCLVQPPNNSRQNTPHELFGSRLTLLLTASALWLPLVSFTNSLTIICSDAGFGVGIEFGSRTQLGFGVNRGPLVVSDFAAAI